MEYLMHKWDCNRTLSERFHHLVHCNHTHPFGDPLAGLGHWRLNHSAIQSIREFYVQAGNMTEEEEEGGAAAAATRSFAKSLSDSLGAKPPPPRKKSKYNFDDVKKYHHSRRKKVIMAHKNKKGRGG
jgi:hypothetical protein